MGFGFREGEKKTDDYIASRMYIEIGYSSSLSDELQDSDICQTVYFPSLKMEMSCLVHLTVLSRQPK